MSGNNPNNVREKEWFTVSWDESNKILLEEAETIIKAGKISNPEEQTILEKALIKLTEIYDDTVQSFPPPPMKSGAPLLPNIANDLRFIKRMELKYLSKWINVKMFLTNAKLNQPLLKGGKGRKSRKGGQGRKGIKSSKGRKV